MEGGAYGWNGFPVGGERRRGNWFFEKEVPPEQRHKGRSEPGKFRLRVEISLPGRRVLSRGQETGEMRKVRRSCRGPKSLASGWPVRVPR